MMNNKYRLSIFTLTLIFLFSFSVVAFAEESEIDTLTSNYSFVDLNEAQPSERSIDTFGIFMAAPTTLSNWTNNANVKNLNYSDVETAGLVELNGERVYFNRFKTSICPSKDQYFPVFGISNATQGFTTNSEEAKATIASHFAVYDSTPFSEENKVAGLTCIGSGNVPSNGNPPEALQNSGGKITGLSMSLAKESLQPEQTYYLVLEPGLTKQVKNSDGEFITATNHSKYVFELTAEHHYVDGICADCGAEETIEPQEPSFSLISSEGTDLLAKKHTTLTVDVENGNVEDYTYKFIVYNKDTQQWYKLRDFDADNTFDWYTGPAGEKTLYADIQDAEGNLTRTQLEVTVDEPTLKVDKFSSSAGTDLAVKSHTTLVARASEGTAPYQYKFIVYNQDTLQWYKIQDFGEANTCDWYTGPEGRKILYVDVKDADGTVVRAPLDVTVA